MWPCERPSYLQADQDPPDGLWLAKKKNIKKYKKKTPTHPRLTQLHSLLVPHRKKNTAAPASQDMSRALSEKKNVRPEGMAANHPHGPHGPPPPPTRQQTTNQQPASRDMSRALGQIYSAR